MDPDEPPAPLGVVLDADRGSLPFALLHGESLVACAAWALGEAGVDLVDAAVPWGELGEAERPVVLHDPLCPATPPDFVAACAQACVADDVVVVGWRPVTDTVKTLEGDALGATVDRDGLRAVASPLVLPARVVAGWPRLPSTDLADLVALLAGDHEIAWMAAPAQARRVAGPEDLRVLEALTADGRPSRGPRGT